MFENFGKVLLFVANNNNVIAIFLVRQHLIAGGPTGNAFIYLIIKLEFY
jgi:hypothetical protein